MNAMSANRPPLNKRGTIEVINDTNSADFEESTSSKAGSSDGGDNADKKRHVSTDEAPRKEIKKRNSDVLESLILQDRDQVNRHP